MKTRWSIAGVLLFALMLAPSALQASARPMGKSSCRLATPVLHANMAGQRINAGRLVASRPGHHTPAPRMHRIRGKRINVQRSTIPALQSFAATRFVAPDALSGLQNLGGPNPPRGPPSQFSL